ncbi:MAG: hypothetical protein K2X34_13095, partial [Hyphomonadaceae bacterium]|nr:hypothetical protein [Hyphomonadaceae bacterium]
RVSPSGRYLARWITVDCGMNAWSNEVLVQDRWFPGLPGTDGRPAGARVTRELDTIVGGSDIEWGEGDVLTLVHGSRVAPEVERRSVGAVRVETRASP